MDAAYERNYSATYEEARERYERYKDRDPFPQIPSALLNAADFAKYVKATGMIYPFEPKRLDGATYAVCLRGLCVYYSMPILIEMSERGLSSDRLDGSMTVDMQLLYVGGNSADIPSPINDAFRDAYAHTAEPTDKIVLRPNSITYVTLEPYFQVPNYVVLRFNLKIKHVYKGLLLGTGPIIDPGFRGRLSIPLHNLTNNEYVFEAGSELIELELTKMSPLPSSNESSEQKDSSEGIPASSVPADRNVCQYISKALEGSPAKGVMSSVQEAVAISKKNSIKTNKRVNKVRKSISERVEAASDRLNITIILTIIALLISIFAVIIPVVQLISAERTTVTETRQAAEYEARIQALEDEVAALREGQGSSDTITTDVSLPTGCTGRS